MSLSNGPEQEVWETNSLLSLLRSRVLDTDQRRRTPERPPHEGHLGIRRWPSGDVMTMCWRDLMNLNTDMGKVLYREHFAARYGGLSERKRSVAEEMSRFHYEISDPPPAQTNCGPHSRRVHTSSTILPRLGGSVFSLPRACIPLNSVADAGRAGSWGVSHLPCPQS